MIVRHDTRALDRVMAASATSHEMPGQRARAVEATVATMVDGQAAVERTRAQGEAHARRWAGNGRFALLAGAGIAVAAVGIGLGIWLARAPNEVLVAETPPPAVEAASLLPPAVAEAVGQDADPAVPVVTNFVIFREVTVSRAGRDWLIQAGHQFDSAQDTTWSKAWCYTQPSVGGVLIHATLAERAASDEAPLPNALTADLRQKLAVDDATFNELATACPWLEASGTAAATKA